MRFFGTNRIKIDTNEGTSYFSVEFGLISCEKKQATIEALKDTINDIQAAIDHLETMAP